MSMQIYKVGGCVRDRLLREQGVNAPTGDIDWVVTGATPEAMLARGFMPVGADFPVFLHPHTHEEYALARTERKTAKGYHGFTFYTAPDVTLEEDLRRRDLTINVMAEDDKGNIKAMPPVLRSDDGCNTVIRPLIYLREYEMSRWAEICGYPLFPKDLCGQIRWRKVSTATALAPVQACSLAVLTRAAETRLSARMRSSSRSPKVSCSRMCPSEIVSVTICDKTE
jgi:hypothetical protein